MIRSTSHQLKKIMLLILFTITCLCAAASVNITSAAQNIPASRPIRFGCYDLKGFIHLNEEGRYEGYGKEYIDMIAAYTGWDCQIIVANNDDLLQMLHNGEIDFLMPVEYTQERLSQYRYPHYPLGEQINGLYVLKSNPDIYYDDFATMEGKRIGSVQDTYPVISLQNYMQDHHITYKNVLYPDLASLHQGLERGEVDAVSRSGLGNIPDDYRLAGITDIGPFYIVSSTQAPKELFSQLNRALIQIRFEHPEFSPTLFEKYLIGHNKVTLHLTREETQYLKEHPTIIVMSFRDRYPISYRNEKTGEMEGILKDLLQLLSQKTGLQFEYKAAPTDTTLTDQLQQNQADLIAGIILTSRYRDDASLKLSNGILNNVIAIVGKKGQVFDNKQHYTVAVPSESTGTIAHIREHHPNISIKTYPSTLECMRAVVKGHTDAAMQNSYVLAALLQHPEFDELMIWTTSNDEGSDAYCLGSRSTEDPRLISIINKGIPTLTKTDIQSVIIKHTANNAYDMSLQDILYKYRFTLILSCLLLLVCLSGAIWRFNLKQKNVQLLEEKNLQLSEANTLANAAMSESKRANQAKTDFLSRMSHDIRTPLNGIIGMTTMAMEENQSLRIADYLNKINISGHFLLSLVNDILDISKIDAGKMELHPEAYQQREFLQYLNGVIRPMCEAKNIAFTVALSYENRALLVDKLKFNQIFFNLLSNAVKFTPEGGHITCSAQHCRFDDPILIFDISIIDDGIGMSPAFQQKLFTPFEQEQPAGTGATGSGLGLAIAHRLITMMGGTIQIKSEIGKGTAFTVHFELETLPATQARATSIRVSDVFLKGKTLLIAEDNDINSEILIYILQNKGAVTIRAHNGSEALQLFASARTGHFDAILMDVRMPVMNGIEATKQIRNLDRPDAKTVPIIATTANAYDEDVQQCLDAGMNDHISKPIDAVVLFKALSKLLFYD